MVSRQVHNCDSCGAELTNGHQPRAGIFVTGRLEVSAQSRRAENSQYTDSGHRRTFGEERGAQEFCSVECLTRAFEDIIRSYNDFVLDKSAPPAPAPQPVEPPPTLWPQHPTGIHSPPPFIPPFIHIEQDIPTTGSPPPTQPGYSISAVDVPFTNTDTTEVCHSPDEEPRETVTIHLNGREHTFLTSYITGADIRGLLGEWDAGASIYLEHVASPDTLVADNEQIVIDANKRYDFYSVPPATFGKDEPPSAEPLNTPDEPPKDEVPF